MSICIMSSAVWRVCFSARELLRLRRLLAMGMRVSLSPPLLFVYEFNATMCLCDQIMSRQHMYVYMYVCMYAFRMCL